MQHTSSCISKSDNERAQCPFNTTGEACDIFITVLDLWVPLCVDDQLVGHAHLARTWLRSKKSETSCGDAV